MLRADSWQAGRHFYLRVTPSPNLPLPDALRASKIVAEPGFSLEQSLPSKFNPMQIQPYLFFDGRCEEA